MPHEAEEAFYRKNRDEYHKKYCHKFLILTGEKLWGVFEDESVAIDAALEQFEPEDFLVLSPSDDDLELIIGPGTITTHYRSVAVHA